MIDAARKPETHKYRKKKPPGPVVSGPNSVPNTKPPVTPPAPFQDTRSEEQVRTECRQKTSGRYLLIFHP